MKYDKKKLIKICGMILMLLSCFFIGKKLYFYKGQMEWNSIFEQKEILLLEILSYAVVMLISPVTYQILIRITTGQKISYREIQYVCCKSNIYKYVPGNIFQYIGRNQLAIEHDLKHSKVAMATILEIGIIIFISMIVAIFFDWRGTYIWIEQYKQSKWIIACIIIILFIAVLILFLFKKNITYIWNKIEEICNIKNVIRLCVAGIWFAIILISDGILFSILFRSVGIYLTFNEIYKVIGIFALSFCVGYIMPGVPGGIGVRESMILFFMKDIIDSGSLVTVTVLFRIISILGDFFAFLVVEIRRWIKKKGK